MLTKKDYVKSMTEQYENGRKTKIRWVFLREFSFI